MLFFDWQNYMLNSDINEQLVGVAGVREDDVVLEIGPGTGSLTNTLINSGAFVLAVEKVCRFLFCTSLELILNQRHPPSYFPLLLCLFAVSQFVYMETVVRHVCIWEYLEIKLICIIFRLSISVRYYCFCSVGCVEFSN